MRKSTNLTPTTFKDHDAVGVGREGGGKHRQKVTFLTLTVSEFFLQQNCKNGQTPYTVFKFEMKGNHEKELQSMSKMHIKQSQDYKEKFHKSIIFAFNFQDLN